MNPRAEDGRDTRVDGMNPRRVDGTGTRMEWNEPGKVGWREWNGKNPSEVGRIERNFVSME
jgi:hypothetical protein